RFPVSLARRYSALAAIRLLLSGRRNDVGNGPLVRVDRAWRIDLECDRMLAIADFVGALPAPRLEITTVGNRALIGPAVDGISVHKPKNCPFLLRASGAADIRHDAQADRAARIFAADRRRLHCRIADIERLPRIARFKNDIDYLVQR